MDQPTGNDSLIGVVLKHRYRIAEKIGESDIFSIYSCEDKIAENTVAVKILLPQYSANSLFAERILVESQAMVGISHPGIIEVYDSGEHEGIYYVITENVQGIDLRERIRQTPALSLNEIVDIGLEICSALEYAHGRGFVHGDLRPGNILITPNKKIKISDFWLNPAINASQSVRTTALLRSVHYNAPEIAEGRPANPASDIYSLGIILYELLAGTVPFDADTPIAIATKHARTPVPPIRNINPSVPKALEEIILKALQKTPESRYRSAKSMSGELRSMHEAVNLNAPMTWSEPDDEEVTIAEISKKPVEVREEDPPVLTGIIKTLKLLVIIAMLGVIAFIAYIYTKPADMTVPSLVGKTVSEAERLTENKVKFIVMNEQYDETFPAGQIYLMSPEAGRTIKAGSKIQVWISKGSRYTRVPSLIKQSLDSAVQQIQLAGLGKGEISQDYSDDVPAYSIIRQNPAAGTKVERGELVSLVFSLGPKPNENTETTGTEEPPSNPTRSFDVKFTVPSGDDKQMVRITVEDDYNETTAYMESKSPGDEINQTVQGVGKNVTIRIYLDDKLVKEEKK